MNTQQYKKSEGDLYKKIKEEVLSEFTLRFGIEPKKNFISLKETKRKNSQEDLPIRKGVKTSLSIEKFDAIQDRLTRLEKRIQTLDETKPEYTEERISLEEKKLFLKKDVLGQKNLSEHEKQLEEVKNLLNKKSFGYVAPVISPVKEEELRIKKAQEASSIENLHVKNVEEKVEQDISDKQLQKASQSREDFIKHLQIMDEGKWYSNPSQNRDKVNEYVIKTAAFLSGKNPSKVNMDDIQTSRLFLFKGAPEKILKHPAFSYIESFYNYQNGQGHSGSDLN